VQITDTRNLNARLLLQRPWVYGFSAGEKKYINPFSLQGQLVISQCSGIIIQILVCTELHGVDKDTDDYRRRMFLCFAHERQMTFV